LHRQQFEKDKQNVDVSLPGKISADAHDEGYCRYQWQTRHLARDSQIGERQKGLHFPK